MVQITKETNAGEILGNYPETRRVFRQFGIQCNG